MRLTDLNVRSLPVPERGQKAYPDETLRGFSVRVSQGGVKTFTLMVGKERRRITIGRYPVIGLAEARAIAKEKLAERTLGKHHPARVIFTDALALFVAEKQQKNRQATVDENKRLLTKYYPALQKKPVAEITTDDITKQLDKLRDTPGTSLHAFWAMRLFMRWCVKRRYVQHNPIEGLDPPSQTKQRERVLTDDELRAVWKAAETIGGNFGKITQLLILTGQRRSEIGGLRADYVKDNSICLPGEITKNKRSHTFPIGDIASNLILDTSASLSQGGISSIILFPARGSTGASFNGWSKAKAQLDKKIADHIVQVDKMVPWTLHDLRRTYATNLQRLGIKLEVIEALLNHVSGTRAGIVGVYNRHRYEAEMREAVQTFEEWFAKTIVSPLA